MEKRKILLVNGCGDGCEQTYDFLDKYYDVSRCTSNELGSYDKKADVVLYCVNGKQKECSAGINLLNGNEYLKDTPFVVAVNDYNENVEVFCLETGASDYLVKDKGEKVFCSRIDKVLFALDNTNRLIKYANRDALTGFYNRNYIENFIKSISQKNSYKAAFMLLDLDNFKAVNDTYGHSVGDEVLVRFAEAIKAELAEEVLTCRLGGDEFVLFIPGDVSKDSIAVTARRILSSVDEALSEIVKEYRHVSVSIGIARYPEDGVSFDKLYMNADKALYYVKQNGKRGFHFFGDQVDYMITGRGEKNVIDIDELKQYINETQRATGAYSVHYDGFKRIYQFVSRCIERTKQDVQILIYTLQTKEGTFLTNEERTEALDELNKCISKVLRRGDVATKYGDTQYVVILMDTNSTNGKLVAKRVMDSWRKRCTNEDVYLEYSIDCVANEY